jgi:hypothetical protein
MHCENVVEASRRFLIGEFIKSDEGVRFCAKSGGILKPYLSQLQFGLLGFAVIPLFTSHLACPAANALGRIDQSRLYGSRDG